MAQDCYHSTQESGTVWSPAQEWPLWHSETCIEKKKKKKNFNVAMVSWFSTSLDFKKANNI